MPKISRLAGILCVGQNHNQAVENFRRTATGQGTMFYASQDGVAYASQSGTDLYNPNGGTELLEEHPDLVEKAEFQSESSTGDVKAYYTICLDGCGSHVISDSAANIQGCCPSCSADLSEITDERVSQHLSESAAADEQVEHEGLVATGATAEEAQRNFATALSNATAFTALSGVCSFNAANTANFDPYTGAEVISNEPQEAPESVAALSSNAVDGEIEAHMFSCSANCEQPFTVSSDEEPVFCAHCSGVLVDAVDSESGDDDSDIDIIDEDDLDLDEDEDDSEDDEDFDSESSADEDEIDDEDDLDDEDLEEDDLDDEDDLDLEDDDEDMDDEDFDSESSSDEDDFDDEDLDEDDLDLDDEDLEEDEDFDSESSSDDEDDLDDLDDEDDLEEDDLDIDDEDEDFDSESNVISHTFDSLSAAQAQHGTLDPSLVSLSRATGGKVDSVYLNYDGMPIARATFASVSGAVSEEVAAKTFTTDNFIRAVSVSLNSNGVAETCSSFGFMPFTIEMPVDKLLVAQSDARINEATETVTSTISEAVEANKERMIAALSASQLGVTKNYWGDVRNPIVESLCSTLTSAGIKEPRAMIERAFIAHGKDFLSVSLAKALELMSKSEVAQNEISESIDAAAGTVTKGETQNVVQQQAVVAPKVNTTATELLHQEPEVQSQSSASTDSSFEDKLGRLRF